MCILRFYIVRTFKVKGKSKKGEEEGGGSGDRNVLPDNPSNAESKKKGTNYIYALHIQTLRVIRMQDVDNGQ